MLEKTETLIEKRKREKEENGRIVVLTETYVFPEEIDRRLDDERRRCIRSILYTLELLMDKESDEYTKARKAVLDFMNDYHRAINKMMQKVI